MKININFRCVGVWSESKSSPRAAVENKGKNVIRRVHCKCILHRGLRDQSPLAERISEGEKRRRRQRPGRNVQSLSD